MKLTARWRESLGDSTSSDIILMIEQRLERQDGEGGVSSVLAALNRTVAAAHQPAGPAGTYCAGCGERWPCSHLRTMLTVP